MLTHRALETRGCVLSIVATYTDALVLKHQAIDIFSDDEILTVLDQFHAEILQLWNHLFIHKHQGRRWSLVMDNKFHSTLYWARVNLSMLGLQLICVGKRSPDVEILSKLTHNIYIYKICIYTYNKYTSVPVYQAWRMWLAESYEFTTEKQSTTKPWSYFMRYTFAP